MQAYVFCSFLLTTCISTSLSSKHTILFKSFFTFCIYLLGESRCVNVIRNHQCLISKQCRKFSWTHHWKPLIVKELTLVQVIVWYITVELIRTKQVPPYLTYSRMHMVPSLKSDIEKQASSVYSTMYRHDDNINKFFLLILTTPNSM